MWSKAEFFIYRVSYFKLKIMTSKEKADILLNKIKIESSDKNEKRRNSNLGLILCNEILESFIVRLTPDQFEFWNEVRNEFFKLNQESEKVIYWTCEKCGKVPNEEVTYEESHDGCGGYCS